MKKFKVLASSTCLFYAEIKAEDEASALQKAADLCESEFIEFDSDWKITEVIEQQIHKTGKLLEKEISV